MCVVYKHEMLDAQKILTKRRKWRKQYLNAKHECNEWKSKFINLEEGKRLYSEMGYEVQDMEDRLSQKSKATVTKNLGSTFGYHRA